MTLQTRQAQGNGTTTITTALTGTGGSNAFGMIAFNKAATATLMTPTASSIADGWTQVGPMLTFGTNQITCWKKRGDGNINSISFTAGGVQVVTTLLEYGGVYDDNFASFNGASLTTAGTTLASGSRTTTEDGEVAVAYLSTGTGSASGYTFSNSYNIPLGASGSTFAWTDRSVATTGTNAATTASWVTSRTAALGVALLRVTEPVVDMEYFLWTSARNLNTPFEILGVRT